MCTATVMFPHLGYRSMMGWVQLVCSTDNESHGEKFETDPFALFGDAPSPYCWYGLNPTAVRHAPSRSGSDDLEWEAHSFLAATPLEEVAWQPRRLYRSSDFCGASTSRQRRAGSPGAAGAARTLERAAKSAPERRTRSGTSGGGGGEGGEGREGEAWCTYVLSNVSRINELRFAVHTDRGACSGHVTIGIFGGTGTRRRTVRMGRAGRTGGPATRHPGQR